MLKKFLRDSFGKHPVLAGLALAVIGIALFLWALRVVFGFLVGICVLVLIWVFVLSPIFAKAGLGKKTQKPQQTQ